MRPWRTRSRRMLLDRSPWISVESHVVELKNGTKVYFCCDNCPKAFKANPKKYDLAVHRQMLETGQIKQVACPLTGKPVNKEQTVEVGTTEVGFCYDKCKGKYEKASDEEKLKLLFSNAAMKKGFKSTKEKDKKEKKDAA